jgi:hypothetical protein
LRLSLAAYGFRDQFKPGKEGTPARMDMYRFLDFCAEQRCDGAELTSYYFEDKITDAELLTAILPPAGECEPLRSVAVRLERAPESVPAYAFCWGLDSI